MCFIGSDNGGKSKLINGATFHGPFGILINTAVSAMANEIKNEKKKLIKFINKGKKKLIKKKYFNVILENLTQLHNENNNKNKN